MLTSKLQELAQFQAKIAEIEQAILAERAAQLQRLHTDLGYATRADLIQALRDLGTSGRGGRTGRRGRKAKAAPAAAASKGRRKGRRKRAKITPELRNQIEAAARAGGKGADIAKKFGVSLPTVQNIKRAAGLTRGKRG